MTMEGEAGAPSNSNRFVNVYPLDSYKIGQKDERKEKVLFSAPA